VGRNDQVSADRIICTTEASQQRQERGAEAGGSLIRGQHGRRPAIAAGPIAVLAALSRSHFRGIDSETEVMKRVVITLFSVGWLGPIWLAADMYLGFWRGDGWLLLQGAKNIGSFPVIQFSQRCLSVGVLWLAAVIIFWSWRLTAPKEHASSPA
jgi:hypothetical protein